MSCEEARVALGALVVGALDDVEAADVREHLRGCGDCRVEFDELRQMPRLLGLVTLAEATSGPPEGGAGLRDRILQQTVAERSRERRRRIGWNAAGAAVITAVAATIGFGLADSVAPVETVDPDVQLLAATDPDTGVRGQVELDGVAWGTRLALELAGVSPGQICSLVAVSSSGAREVAANWTVPAATPDDKYLTVPGAASLQPDRIDTFEIVTGDGRTVLRLSYDDVVTAIPGDGGFAY